LHWRGSGEEAVSRRARARPDEDSPKRVAIAGTFHMLRHFFVAAMLQSGVDMKTAQTLAGHHSAAFTVDQYADAVPQQLKEAGEKVATVLLDARTVPSDPCKPAPIRSRMLRRISDPQI
jgi:integrase